MMMMMKTMKGLAYMMMLIDHAVINVTTLARKMCFFCIHVSKETCFFFGIFLVQAVPIFIQNSSFVHIDCCGYES